MGTSFRIAGPEDLPAIADLCSELGYPASAAEVGPRLAAIREGPAETVLVAEGDGEVVGWIQVQALQTLVDEPFGLIAGLVVKANWRGRGIGAGLVAEAEAWARARGLGRMVVRSRLEREAAHRFYEQRGYELRKTQRLFARRLEGGAPPGRLMNNPG